GDQVGGRVDRVLHVNADREFPREPPPLEAQPDARALKYRDPARCGPFAHQVRASDLERVEEQAEGGRCGHACGQDEPPVSPGASKKRARAVTTASFSSFVSSGKIGMLSTSFASCSDLGSDVRGRCAKQACWWSATG